MMGMRWWATAAAVFMFASPARADEQAEAGDAQAQALFDEAKQLIMQGKWAEACPKLARSNQLEARATTRFRLAECYEHTGKTATAWSAYLIAASDATAAGETKRAEYARERAKKLEPALPALILSVAQRPVTVYRDGERIEESRWGTKMPVDPGEHLITAQAPGREGFSSTIYVLEATTTVVTIPALPATPVPVSAPDPVPAHVNPATTETLPPPADHRALRRWGVILTGVGLASVGTGATLALTSSSTDNCSGTCAAGTGFLLTGAVIAATGLAFFLASLGDGAGGRVSEARKLELRF